MRRPNLTRTTVSLSKGTVILTKGGTRTLASRLMEITTTDILCRVNWNTADPASQLAWKRFLTKGTKLKVDLTAPPYVFAMICRGQVANVKRVGPTISEITITFLDLVDVQVNQIARTVGVWKDREASGQDPEGPQGNEKDDRAAQLRKLASNCRGERFENLVVSFGKVTQTQMEQARSQAEEKGRHLDRCLWKMGLLNPADICQVWSLQSGLSIRHPEQVGLPARLPEGLPYDVLKRMECMPFQESEKGFLVSVVRPLSDEDVEILTEKLSRPPVFHIVPIDAVDALLEQAASPENFKPRKRLTRRKEFSRRENPRFKLCLPLMFQLCDEGGASITSTVLMGETVDISEGGVAVTGNASKNRSIESLVGGKAWCHISIFIPPHQFSATCKICHVQQSAKDSETPERWLYGLQFINLSDVHRESLTEICRNLKHEG